MMTISKAGSHNLDLRGVACPINFVKTKLFLDKLAPGDRLLVLLDAGEPVESVCQSIAAEGHTLEKTTLDPGGHYCVIIRKG